MNKKALACILTATMGVSALTGCGGSNNDTTKAADAKNDGTTKSGEKVVLDFMAIGTASNQDYIDWVESCVDVFNKDNDYNAEVKMQWYEGEQYKTKLATLMTQNEVTDLFQSYEAGFLKNYTSSGRVMDLTDFINSDSEMKERFPEGSCTSTTFDGKTYALPSGELTVPMYYNKDIFKKYNLEVPKTWDDFLNIIKTLKDNKVTPIAMGSKEAWIAGNMMLEIMGSVTGSGLFSDIASDKVKWTDSRFVEAGDEFKKLVDMGAFNYGFLGIPSDEARLLFTSEKTAMFQQGSWETEQIVTEMGSDEKVGAFYLPPKTPECAGAHEVAISRCYGISEECKNKDAALAFLKVISDPKLSRDNKTEGVDKLTLEVRNLRKEITYNMVAMDRQFSGNVGSGFNNVSVAIAGGADSKEQFEELQRIAEQDSNN